MSEIRTLPSQAFDGQIFVDAYRVEWKFDGSTQCWQRVGQRSDIPVASELQTGLLSAKLKQLIDGIPEGGGHFGIVAQPLLSLVPQNPNIILKDKVQKSILTDSGTSIIGNSIRDRALTPEHLVGKLLVFRTGILAKKAFLVFTNDQESIFIEGDASESSPGDEYEVLDSAEFNPSGVLLGDILLVSDTIDISCVDGEGIPLPGGNCNSIQCDNVNNPPGLDFKLNDDFLDSLCVIVPGCKGPPGERGDTGDPGADGTGDGPQGEQGDPGTDAPAIGNTFTGIKIIDVDDIYDTAVVSMELDAASGKLNIVRAKVRTPDSSTPATQLLSTPINRAVKFKDNKSFDYTLVRPSVDPVDDVDVDLLKYPRQYSKPDGRTPEFTTTVSKVKLSELVNSVISYYEAKLNEINDDYNKQLKEYIETKDTAARNILANLAQQVAECEFELPIDFCLGIIPADCGQQREEAAVSFNDPLSSLILSFPEGEDASSIVCTDMGLYTIIGTPTPPVPEPDTPGGEPPGDDIESEQPELLLDPSYRLELEQNITRARFPNNTVNTSVEALPTDANNSTLYMVQYVEGYYTKGGLDANGEATAGHLVGTGLTTEGLQVVLEGTNDSGDTVATQKSFPAPTLLAESDGVSLEEAAVREAYSRADMLDKSVTMDATGLSNVRLWMVAIGDAERFGGSVIVNIKRCVAPSGTTTLDGEGISI